MKRILFILIALVLLAVPSGATVAQTPEAQQDDQPTIQDRIQARKDKLKLTIDTAKTNSLKEKCKSSQGKLQAASKRIQGVRTSRSEVYNNLTNRLNTAKEKLTNAELDTTELTKAMAELADTIVDYKATMTNYQLAVDDASTLDCVADPEAFWVSISDARQLVANINTTHQKIKTMLKDTIKPELVELRKQLGTNATEEAQ